MKYFYDGQFRKYIQQFIRLFSGFVVETGKAYDGSPIYRTVPVNYGDMSRMAAHILKNNSENMLNTAPFISLYISSINMAPERRTYQQHTSTTYINEKKFDYDSGSYTDEPGDKYEVTRYNPVPYNITFNVDIWTSNTDQKLQLIEQLYTLYNPHINIKTNSSGIDWSNLTYVEMKDTTWTSRSIPSGVDDVIDIHTLQFMVPIYLNPPAQIRKQKRIHTILTKLNVLDDENLKFFEYNKPFSSQLTNFTVITLENYKLQFTGDRAILLTSSGSLTDSSGSLPNWNTILPLYGQLREGFSQIHIRRNNDITDDSEDIIGTISIDPLNVNQLMVTVDPDTLPTNTLGAIDKVVDGTMNYPGDGILPSAQLNQKYLLIGETSSDGIWGLSAKENDIITYNGSNWIIYYDSSSTDIERVYNSDTEEQYEWDGEIWKLSYIGIYNPGYWRLYL